MTLDKNERFYLLHNRNKKLLVEEKSKIHPNIPVQSIAVKRFISVRRHV